MAIIDIYQGAPNSAGGAYSPGSAGGYSSANAAAYAALAGGNAANTVIWRGGQRITREAQWWGFVGAKACEKRIEHQIDSSFGSDTVICDGWQRYGPSDTTGTWSAVYGLWYIDVFTGGGAVRDNSVDRVFFGSDAGDTLASMQFGIQYKQADSLLQVSSDGQTRAGMLAGNGIWYYDAVDAFGDPGDDTARLYIWTPGQAYPPAVYWEGLAIGITPADSSTAAIATPRYSPFCAGRSTGATDDPSGTIVRAGFVTCGTTLQHVGANKDSKQALPVSDVLYEDIRCYGGKYLIRLGSSTVGATMTDYTIDTGFHDDLVDPAYFPLGIGDSSGGSEVISLGYRAKSMSCFNITSKVGITHGVVNFGGPSTADAEERNTDCIVSGLTAYCRELADDARALSITNSDGSRVSDALFVGFNTRGHWGGADTLLHNCEWRGQQPSATDPTTARSVCDIRQDLDGSPISVKARGVIIDRRGDYARGITEPWGCLEFRGSNSGGTFPAGGLDIRDSVLLVDEQAPISVPIWASHTSQTPSLVQTVVRVFTNSATQVMSGTGTGTTPSGATTFAAHFVGGTVSDIVTDTTNEILRRADRPVRRYGELTLGAVV